MAKAAFNEATIAKLNKDTGVVMLPSVVIAMACDPTKAPNLAHLKACPMVDLEPLKITADEMKKLIDEQGDVELQRLYKVCPGFDESGLGDGAEDEQSKEVDEEKLKEIFRELMLEGLLLKGKRDLEDEIENENDDGNDDDENEVPAITSGETNS